LFLLFCRYLPMIAMAEVKGILPQAQGHAADRPHELTAAEQH
jgi:molybdopterin-containing oxidoreductase family membrane subunit